MKTIEDHAKSMKNNNGKKNLEKKTFFQFLFSRSFRRRGERCLRLMLHLGRGPQAAAGSAHMCGVQAFPGHRFLFFLASPLAFLFLSGQLLLRPQSSVRRRVRLLSFSGGHFPFFLLFSCARPSGNSLLRMFSPSLGNVPAFAPVELSLTFPVLLVLRLGLNSPSHNLVGMYG